MDLRLHMISTRNHIEDKLILKHIKRMKYFNSVKTITHNTELDPPLTDKRGFDLIPEAQDEKFRVGIVSCEIEGNWFMRPDPECRQNRYLISAKDSETVVYNQLGWSREKYIAYMILKSSLVIQFLRKGGQYFDLFSLRQGEGIFHFAKHKCEAQRNIRDLQIGRRAREVLAAQGLDEESLDRFEKSLSTLNPSLRERLGYAYMKHPLANGLILIVIGIISGIAVDGIEPWLTLLSCVTHLPEG